MSHKSDAGAIADIVRIDLDDNTSIGGGGTNIQTLKPPVGFIYVIRSIYYSCPATTGGVGADTHELRITHAALRYEALLRALDNSYIYIYFNEFDANSLEVPGANTDQYNLCTGGRLQASYDLPLLFEYANTSPAGTQNGNRLLTIICEKVVRAL